MIWRSVNKVNGEGNHPPPTRSINSYYKLQKKKKVDRNDNWTVEGIYDTRPPRPPGPRPPRPPPPPSPHTTTTTTTTHHHNQHSSSSCSTPHATGEGCNTTFFAASHLNTYLNTATSFRKKKNRRARVDDQSHGLGT